MTKNKNKTQDVAEDVRENRDTNPEPVTFENPVRELKNHEGPVTEEEARKINGYEGHENIRSQIEEDKARKGVDLDEDTDTGAKKF